MRESLLQCSGAVPCLFYHMRSPTRKEGAPCGARVFRGRRGGWDFESEGIGRQTIGDEAILAEKRTVAELEGAFICPEGAAAFAAARTLRESGWIRDGETVVVLNTGTGLKYADLVQVAPPVLEPGDSLSMRE